MNNQSSIKTSFFHSVRFKLPLIFILLVLISLQLVGGYFIRELEQQMRNSFEDQMQTQISLIQDTVRPLLANRNNQDEREFSQQLRQQISRFNSNQMIEIQALDDHGIILATTDPAKQADVGKRSSDRDVDRTIYYAKPVQREFRDSERNGRVERFTVPLFSSNDPGTLLGLLRIDSDIETVYDQIQSITVIFLTSSAIALAVTVLLTFLISKEITRPLEETSNQIQKIAEGNYSERVVPRGNDEIGQLARSVNYLSIRVKEAQDSIESERQRLDSVLRHMSDGVIATNRRNHVVLTNDRALELVGKTEHEVMGKSILSVLNLKDRYTFRQLSMMDEPIMMYFEGETPEELTIIKGETSVIQRESGFVSGMVWVLTDVTEHEKIENDRKQFVSNVSHELRTPLTSVRSYSEALADGAVDDPEISREFLNVIQQETDRMIRMITDLLSLSRMDAKQEKFDFELVDFTALVNHVLDRFDVIVSSASSSKKYKIKRELTSLPVWIEADSDKIIQVIDNIINNAIKYSPNGGTITVRLMTSGNDVVLSIQDEGIGIPQKALTRIFERFYRVDKARSRAQGGTGLGLAISKEVVARHHGRIWANSIENKGSTFFISFPYTQVEGEWEE